MVSLVIVSHSATLAEGVRELADQMAQGQVQIATAGGIDDPDNPIGTDPMKVMAAIESVYSEDGVVVLMDLGSALMSAEMALEFLDPDQREHVALCAAPLVEGAVAAAVQAMAGGTPQQIIAEATAAVEAKRKQLAPLLGEEASASAESTPPPTEPPADALELTLTVPNKLGLHARPAAKLVGLANQFSAEISITKDTRRINAKSINQVVTLGARQGDAIVIRAVGADAADALDAVQALANDNFGDRDDVPPAATAAPDGTVTAAPDDTNGILHGQPASNGIAIGPVVLYEPTLPPTETVTISDATAEWQRLRAAIDAAVAELDEVQQTAGETVGSAEAAIFAAHQLILTDPELGDAARGNIDDQCINAEAAWEQAIHDLADSYRAIPDAYMRARANDVMDAGSRVLRHLMGVELPALTFERPSILVARELTPSDTARLEPDRVLGIITELGGPTGHSAILARALGIPAIVGAVGVIGRIDRDDATPVAIDGATGQIWLTPEEDALDQLRQQQTEWQAKQNAAKAAGQGPAITRDGTQIEIAANIGGPNDVALALEYGAEGVGLFRTEFLFMDRNSAPTEKEQTEAYVAAARLLRDQPLIIRTLDVGGDKPIPYLGIGDEANPFLGWRAIRYCLDNVDLFMRQLRAICRAGAGHNIKVMFPMVATYAELHRAKALLGLAMSELEQEGVPFNPEMEAGIMVEVPSAVQVADQLAGIADFFSIGTNDLTQYLLAADRGNSKVAELATALQPAVLRAVKTTVDVGHAHGIWVGMCGELAGNPLATPVLIGLGLDELSMSAPSIPRVKQIIRQLGDRQAQDIANAVLALDSADRIRYYLENHVHLGQEPEKQHDTGI